MKVSENAVIEKLLLGDERKPEVKRNRRENVALNQLLRRRAELLPRRAALTAEIEKLDAAILALE